MHCIVCKEVIKDPICPECLCECIMASIGEKAGKKTADFIESITKLMIDNSNNFIAGQTNYEYIKCIRCNKPILLCPHCYTEEIFSILAEYPELISKVICYTQLEKKPIIT